MSKGFILSAGLEFSLADSLRLLSVEGDSEGLIGFSPSQLLASAGLFRSRVHAGDLDLAASLFDEHSGPAEGSLCLRLRHADDRIRCVQVDFSRSHDRLSLNLQDAKSLRQNADEHDDSFRAILDNATESVLFKDRNHIYTAASAAFRRSISWLLGGREIVGLTDYDFLPEADADLFYAPEKQVLSGTGNTGVHEIVRLGPTRWVEVRNYPIKSPAGELVGLYAVAVNLTDRIKAEEQVYHANQALPESQKLPPIGTYILDIQRGAFTTSASLDAMLGLPDDYSRDVAGWTALVHPADRDAVLTYFHDVIANPGRIFSREYRVVRPADGGMRWVQGIGRVDRDANGRPLLMRGSVQDISERKDIESALRDTKKRLELFIEHAPAALAMYDREMRYLAVSQRWRQLYGVYGDVLGLCHYDVVPDIPERWKDQHRRALNGESFNFAEDRFERADGSVIWIRGEVMPWRFDDDSIGGVLIFVEDITERKRAQERVELAASVIADASEAIFVTDLEGNIVEVNEAFSRITGYSRTEIIGQHSHVLKSDRHGDEQYAELEQSVVATGRWRGEQWLRRKDGTIFEASATITTVFNNSGNPAHFVGLFFDITPMREQERKLQQVTHFDDLTGLPNRSLVLEKLRHATAAVAHTGQIVGVFLFDIDDFKHINERHGRETADSFLVTVAERMQRVLRDGDTLARVGGDEFMVVLPNVQSTAAAAHVAERLMACIAEPIQLGDNQLQLCASAGATFYPQAEEVDADQMTRQTMQAMYEAKLAGKNRYQVFDAARDYDLRGRYGEIGRIRQGLKAGEFVLHYQPKVDMASGSLIGVEALIRWQHPERGLLLPGSFLSAIENDDLAIEVGEWVIDTALRQIAAWADEGRRIPVSVNMSARHLQQPDFVNRLRALLDEHPEVDPGSLELEILETSAVQDVAYVSGIIQACLGMGIQVAIDDFGTGYASLSYLKRLPATVLKIDQGFVRHMLEDPDDLAILQGIMGLANAFRRTPVAEGVETVEQGLLLLKLGCSAAQGYGIARPMPASDLVSWYSQWWPDPRWRRTSVLNAQEWPGLIAQVELRAWIHSLERFLKGLQPAPPEMDERRCRFSLWLEGESSGPRSNSPSLRRLQALHQRSHLVGRKAVELCAAGQLEESLTLLRSAGALVEEMEAGVAALISSAELKVTPFDTTGGTHLPMSGSMQ